MTANPRALSDREKETLRLLLEGHDAKSIARNLGISVHTVNERLRGSRRKLEVGSSREAARILARHEQWTPNSVVYNEIGLAGDAGHPDNGRRRAGRKGVEHPLVLAIGGTLIMSLVIATAMLTSLASGATEPGPLPHWSTATAAPDRGPRAMNTIRVEGDQLLWNGGETSAASARDLLGIVNQMNPQPLVVLSYSAQTPPERVHRARLLIDEEIQCKPSECLEITISPPGTRR
jgi:DNA-binding CsgD family transcriptional regulator